MKIDAEQQPDVRAIYGTKYFRLMVDYDPPGFLMGKLTVPANFVCDMASIWRWFWSAAGVRLGGRIRAAALVHDWLYYHCGKAPGDVLRSRENVDDVFRILMREAGMEPWRIFKCYWAVRVGGWKAWNAHARRIAEAADGGDA